MSAPTDQGSAVSRIIVRRAAKRDVGEIAALWESAWLPPSRKGFRAEIARLRRRDPELLLVALRNGRVLGAVAGSFDGRTAVVSRLAVAAGSRRQGIGRRLVEALCTELDALGATAEHLLVVDHGMVADAFWNALGFERGAETPAFIKTAPR